MLVSGLVSEGDESGFDVDDVEGVDVGKGVGTAGREYVTAGVGVLVAVGSVALVDAPVSLGLEVEFSVGVGGFVGCGWGSGLPPLGTVAVGTCTGGGLKKRSASTHPAPRKNEKTRKATNLLKRVLNTCMGNSFGVVGSLVLVDY